MRTESSLAKLLWPKARRRILGLLLAHPDEEWHLRDIARLTDLASSTVQREVTLLHEAGILSRRPVGNQVNYSANTTCPIFPELQGIVLKTCGLADLLRAALADFAQQIDLAFIFGSVARREVTSDSDVDLLIVGEVGLRELVPALREAEDALRREVNPVVMSVREFGERARDGEHFVSAVLEGPKLFLIGDEDDVKRLAG